MKKLTMKQISYVLLALVLILFVVCNVFFNILTEKYSVKLDITDQKLYDLSSESEKVLATLPETRMLVFSNEEEYPVMTKEIIAKYQTACSNLSVTYIDYYQNPTYVDKYNAQGYKVNANDIIIESDTRVKLITMEEMFGWNYDKTQVKSIKAEQVITSGLIYVNQEIINTAVFLMGHNETPSASLKEIFKNNNFDVEDLTLSVMDLKDQDIVIIASPTRDYETAEIQKLDSYMERGGNLMVFMEPSVASFPNLKAFLEKWQIGVTDDVVIEPEIYMLNNPLYIVPIYMGHKINTYFNDNKLFMVVPQTRSLEILSNSGAIKTDAILMSTSNAYGKTNLQYSSIDKEEGDLSGAFNLAIMSEKAVYDNGQQKVSRMFVMGSKNVYGDDLLSVSSYANGAFLTQTLSYMVDTSVNVNIPAKTIEADPITITTAGAIAFAVTVAGIIPISILIYGAYVCARRKKL